MSRMRRLTIIGAGHLGQTLGRLWADGRTLHIGEVVNRTPASSAAALDFIGAGTAVASIAPLSTADIVLIATPDDRIAEICDTLAAGGKLTADSIVFHCSGASTSALLAAASGVGAAVASIHPVRSFAQPAQVAANFAGTRCGVEGDARALVVLEQAFADIGAQFVIIKAEQKVLYHAAAVFACNYLVTLQDVARAAYVEAGMTSASALAIMEPLVRETMDNIFRHGPEQALSGPIARGDMATVARQQAAVTAWNPAHGALYAQFAELTRALAARRTMSAAVKFDDPSL